jgi:phosphate transport system substrate-binding protein
MKKTVLNILLILLVVSCKKETAKTDVWDDTLSQGIIRIACDENFKPLMDAEIEVFELRNPGAVILPIYTNETEAIRLLTVDSVRLALTTRDLSAREQAALGTKKMKARKHLIGFDGIALITNVLNKDSVIGMPTLIKILTGEITGWSQINPQSPVGTIRVIVDNKESGVLRYVVDSIVRSTNLTSQIYAMNNHAEVIEKVIQMPNALGIIGANFLNNSDLLDQKKLRLMRLSKSEPATVKNSYLPYAGDIMQENYPLWRPVYVLLSDPKSGLSSGFSIFLAHEIGQLILMKCGLLPITDPQNKQIMIKDEFPNNQNK